MPNEASDYSSLILKLLEKTRNGKVDWKEAEEDFGAMVNLVTGSQGSFRAHLEQGFTFHVDKVFSRGDTTYKLRMSDAQGRTVFEVSFTDDPDTMIRNRAKYETIGEIYDLARRKALKVDEKIERVSEILERI